MNVIQKILIGVLFLAALAVGYYWVALVLQNEGEQYGTITSFEECVSAGYPILESYPEQCVTPEGEYFTREVEEDESNNNDAEVTDTRTIQLYYYNVEMDTDASGNIMCSDEGLIAVERTIPVGQTPIQDAINLLLRGELLSQEEEEGITTEFPLEGFELGGASLVDGTLTLAFSDPNNATSGGSCRAGILWAQIRNTALQFDVVKEVQFQPEELFQP